jgi:superfamily I DNA/RNA helicase
VQCSREEIEDFSGDETAARTAEAAVGYGAGERREREANLFALELLLPTVCLRKAFVEEGASAEHIAKTVGMPVEVIAGQLARAVLVPAEVEKEDKRHTSFKLDPSQLAAAETEECPVLVSAGPGTGKTQTLTHRIAHLLKKGVDPQSILALTFSNKAAAEMRERVEAIDPAAAARLQVMTFHAFGLDLLRKYWNEAGLDPNSPLLDRVDAILLLEKHLAALKLEHYRNLHEPTMNLSAILTAISRAKDELCTPDHYRELAEGMLANASDADDELKAQKALEVALVYEFYERHLRENKLLDFGDLVFLAVRLMQTNEAVRKEVRSRFKAILVDEFQDVNRACGVLLREVAGVGENLWAVGDLRQSIYRWRGASPANIRLFGEDFPNARMMSLEVNYRSSEEIVGFFSEFAGRMKAGGAEMFCSWEANRGAAEKEAVTPITFTVAATAAAEARAIARKVQDHIDGGRRFKDQAVICRTHKQLAKLSKELSEGGVPVFYLGDLFERDEIRDLLALLDLKHDSNGFGLVRVARFAEYGIPIDDVRKVIQTVAVDQIDPRSAVAKILESGELSEKGRDGLGRLLEHLGSEERSAWSFLVEYLFERSGYLRPLLAERSVESQAKLLAVYQFLRFAESVADRFTGDDRIDHFLRHVRAIAWFGEDRSFAQMPDAAASLDAVRLLTVHGCKGLEFPVVYTPWLGDGQFPSSKRGSRCPDPDGLTAELNNQHEEEEECLFFVAMSRARDHLHLSRAEKYTTKACGPSRFLEGLARLPAYEIAAEEAVEADMPLAATEPLEADRVYYASELDEYLRCPRQYYYSRMLGLRREDERSVFVKFHSCVNAAIRSLESMPRAKNFELAEAMALEVLEDHWAESGIDGHVYAPIYREIASEMLSRALTRIGTDAGEISSFARDIQLENGIVRLKADSVESAEGAITVRRFKTGKSPSKQDIEHSEALVVHAIGLENPDAEINLRKIYLTDDVVMDIKVTSKVAGNRKVKYEEAIAGIGENRFPPVVNDRNCPHCSYFFICPSDG